MSGVGFLENGRFYLSFELTAWVTVLVHRLDWVWVSNAGFSGSERMAKGAGLGEF